MEQNMTPLVSNESEAISRILEFLTYSGVDAVKKYDEESDLYQIFIPEDQYDRASALLAIFMEQEPSEEEEAEADEPVRSFVGNGERYQENSSSAFSFLTVGLLVAALLLLCTFHVIPIPLTWDSQPVMYAALWIITAAFLIIGIFSLWKARDYRQKMHEDAEFEAGVLKWFLDTYDGDQIDHTIEANEGEIPQEEILCLKRLDLIRGYLMREYPSLDESYADRLSENLYQTLYESK